MPCSMRLAFRTCLPDPCPWGETCQFYWDLLTTIHKKKLILLTYFRGKKMQMRKFMNLNRLILNLTLGKYIADILLKVVNHYWFYHKKLNLFYYSIIRVTHIKDKVISIDAKDTFEKIWYHSLIKTISKLNTEQ